MYIEIKMVPVNIMFQEQHMMQCKRNICLNRKSNLTKIGKCWLKRKNITKLLNKCLYNSLKLYDTKQWR